MNVISVIGLKGGRCCPERRNKVEYDMGYKASDTGVYRILNTVTGEAYIGSTTNTRKRWYEHRWALKDGIHKNAHLQAAWEKHGEASFVFELLCKVPVDQLLIREMAEMNKRKYRGKLYNHFLAPEENTVGARRSPETKLRLAIAARKSMANPIVKERHRAATRAAIASPEVRKKMSDAAKKRRVKANNWGYKYDITCPDGRQLVVTNLTEFCEQEGNMNPDSFGHAMRHGRLYKGYVGKRF